MSVDFDKLEAYAKRHARKSRANRFVWGPGEVEICHSPEELEEAKRRAASELAEALEEAREEPVS